MSDFSGWDEVKSYLEAEDLINCVMYHRWTYGDSCKDCADGCCTDYFDSVDEVIKQLRIDCSDRLDKVESDEV